MQEIKAGQAYIEVTAQTQKAQEAVDKMQKNIQDKLNALVLASADLKGLFDPLVSGTKTTINAFTTFSDTMNKVAAATTLSKLELDALSTRARALAASTTFSAQEIAQAMKELAEKGFSGVDISKMIRPIMLLSRAMDVDLVEAAKVVASAMHMFEIKARDITSVTDTIVNIVRASALTFHDFAEALEICGPIASEVGLSLEETALILAWLSENSVKGTMAGQALRTSFARLLDVELRQWLKDVIDVSVEAEGEMRDLGDVLLEIINKAEQLGEAGRQELLEKVFSTRAVIGPLSMTSEKLSELQERLKETSITTEEAAAIADAGIGRSFRELASAIEAVTISLGEAFSGSLQVAVSLLTSGFLAVNDFINSNKVLVSTLAGAIGAFTLFAVTLTTLVGIIKGVIVAYSALQAIIIATETLMSATSIGKIVLIIGGVITAIGAIVGLTTSLKAQASDTKSTLDDVNKAVEETQKKLEQLTSGQKEIESQEALKRLRSMETIRYEEELERRLREIKIESIEDEFEREIARIELRYEYERKKAEELNADLQKLEELRLAEIERVRQRFEQKRREEEERERQKELERLQREQEELERRRKDFIADIDDEIAELRIRTEKEGLDQKIALIEREYEKLRQQAQELGLGPEELQKLEEWKQLKIKEAEMSTQMGRLPTIENITPGFSAFALMAQASGPQNETARNTREIVSILKRIEQKEGFLLN